MALKGYLFVTLYPTIDEHKMIIATSKKSAKELISNAIHNYKSKIEIVNNFEIASVEITSICRKNDFKNCIEYIEYINAEANVIYSDDFIKKFGKKYIEAVVADDDKTRKELKKVFERMRGGVR